MNLETFLLGLLVVSTLTGLVTEAMKKWMTERKINYYANELAGIVAIVLSAAVAAAYVILAGLTVDAKLAVYVVALIALSWLCAMVGYDKVIQALSQFKTYSGKE